MRELATRWSDLLLADVGPGDRPTRAVRDTGSVLRPPATEDQVAATERRIGRRLPPSYREFLLLSDGAYADLNGVRLVYPHGGPEQPPAESDVVGVVLLPVADLRWLRDVDPFMASLCAQDDDEPDPVVVDGQDAWPWTPFASGLVVAVDHRPGTTCLVPVDGEQEWQVWHIAKETSQVFVSFRSFLAHQVEIREPVTTVAETLAVIERAKRGEHRAVRRLARVTAPDAVDVLAGLLAERAGWAAHAVHALGRIGTDEAVDALVRVRPQGAPQALLLAGSDRARDALADWGCVTQLAALGDPRGTALAVERLRPGAPAATRDEVNAAIQVLAVHGDAGHVDVLQPHLDGEPLTEFLAAYALAVLGAEAGRHRLEQIAAGGGPMHASAEAWVHILARRDAAAGTDLG